MASRGSYPVGHAFPTFGQPYALPAVVQTLGAETEKLGIMCPVCSAVVDSANKMARHMYVTKHCLSKCPTCDTYIVGRAFRASLQKVIDNERAKSAKLQEELLKTQAAVADDRMSASRGMTPDSSSTLGSAAPQTIDVDTHAHLQLYPDFHVYEKNCFRQVPLSRTGSTSCASRFSPSGQADSLEDDRQGMASHSEVSAGPQTKGFVCVGCQNEFTTWTQMTRHLDNTNHTLPTCSRCQRHLKCFGPLRPQKHDESSAHTGFWGHYYSKQDYLKESQDVQTMYTNPRNKFTGFTQLQYKCVCGLVFVHPVLLAEHLVQVHKVSCIGTGEHAFYCKTCEVSLRTLGEARKHIKGTTPTAADVEEADKPTEKSMDERTTTTPGESASMVLQPSSSSFALNTEATFDYRQLPQYSHEVVVSGFNPAPFLLHRPVSLACLGELASPQQGSRSVSVVAPTAAPAVNSTAATEAPYFVVLYQCRECLHLFSSWERVLEHLRGTGHCSTYCATCARTVSLVERPYPSHTAMCTRLGTSTPSSARASVSSDSDGSSSTLPQDAGSHEHVCCQHNVLAEVASPESLEVLVNYNATVELGRVDPPLERFLEAPLSGGSIGTNVVSTPRDPAVKVGQQPRICFQCPASEKGCYAVFISYGELVEHFLSTNHGNRRGAIDKEPSLPVYMESHCAPLYSRLPMVEYRKRFTNVQLITHFGFRSCDYCHASYPPDFMELHLALCSARWRSLANDNKNDSAAKSV